MSLGSTISRNCFDLLRALPSFALMCDETTDNAVIKEVIIYARYFDSDRKIQTASIGMSEVPDGSAKTIVGVLRQLCDREKHDIDHKLCDFSE